jgi:hypothetical protein
VRVNARDWARRDYERQRSGLINLTRCSDEAILGPSLAPATTRAVGLSDDRVEAPLAWDSLQLV